LQRQKRIPNAKVAGWTPARATIASTTYDKGFNGLAGAADSADDPGIEKAVAGRKVAGYQIGVTAERNDFADTGGAGGEEVPPEAVCEDDDVVTGFSFQRAERRDSI